MTNGNYRLRITDYQKNTSYIVRDKGAVRYFGADEQGWALSNLFGRRAAEMRFALLDTPNENSAARTVRDELKIQWARNMVNCPSVEIL